MLDNGIALILGRTALVERLNRFVLAYELNLKEHIEQIVYIDCRYTNGLAIGYKTGYKVGSKTRA
jgi:cell division protein FtsQ